MTDKGLLPREQAILTEIIEYYISRHEAVSARTLSKISDLSLSPTTIRNLMEDPSDGGYLTHLGGARGRLPTRKAFYIYIDKVCGKLLRAPPGEARQASPKSDESLVDQVERLGAQLSEDSGLAAVALLPGCEAYPLDWVRFSAIDARRVLVSVGTPFGDLWSKVVESHDSLSPAMLGELEAFLTDHYRGQPMAAIRTEIMSGGPMEQLAGAPSLGAAFRMLRSAFDWQQLPKWCVWGESRLLGLKEMQEPAKMLRLHGALRDTQMIVRASENWRHVEGGMVAIGTEIGIEGLEDLALVAFPFGWDPARPGYLAVIGPMHMDYGKVLQLVGWSAHSLNQSVNR